MTFVTVAFPTAFHRNGDAEMSQSILFRTMQAVVMNCVCQSWIKKLLTYLLTYLRTTRHDSTNSMVFIYSSRDFWLFTARCMHFSAKRVSAVLRSHVVCLSVCPSMRPSVRLSVTLVDCDHIGWNSSKLISSLISLGCSLFATPTWRVCSKGNTPKFGPKVTHPCWFERRRHSIANCGWMVTDSATVTMESL